MPLTETTYKGIPTLNTEPAGDGGSLLYRADKALADKVDTAATDILIHSALTSAHGTTSAVVGINDTQTLTNKSIVATQLTGTIADARLSVNVPLLNAATNAFTGAETAISFDASQYLRAKGSTPPASGAGIEIAYESAQNRGYIFAYDRTGGVAKNICLQHPGGKLLVGTVTDDGVNLLQVAGTIIATSFSGSGANLTSLPAAQLTGTVGVTTGGTGLSSATTGNVLYASGTNTWSQGTPDTAGLVAKSGAQTGIAGDKTWTGNQTINLSNATLSINNTGNGTGNFPQMALNHQGGNRAFFYWDEVTKAFIIRADGASSDGTVRIASGGTTPRLTIDATGHVVIGATSANSRFYVVDTNQTVASYGNILINTTDGQAADVGGSLVFGGRYSTTDTTIAGWAGVAGPKENSTDNNAAGYLSFRTRAAGGSLSEKMRIASNGYVGINTSPAQPLHVKGVSGSNTYIRIEAAAATDQAAIEFVKNGTQKWIMYSPASSNDLVLYNGSVNKHTFFGGGGITTLGPVASQTNDSTSMALLMTGVEAYNGGSFSSTDGVFFTAGVNRTNNRQFWMGSSVAFNATRNSSDAFFRFLLSDTGGTPGLDAISSDGTTIKNLTVQGTTFAAAGGITTAAGLIVTGTVTAVALTATQTASTAAYSGTFDNTGSNITKIKLQQSSSTAGAACEIGFGGSSGTNTIFRSIRQTTSTGALSIVTDGFSTTNAVLIDSNGKVGIGSAYTSTAGPPEALSVSGNVIASGPINSGAIKTITANYTATVNDQTLLVDATSGQITVTLPAVASNVGRRYTAKLINAANALVLDGNGAELVEGSATQTLSTTNTVWTIQSNGTAWYKI